MRDLYIAEIYRPGGGCLWPLIVRVYYFHSLIHSEPTEKAIEDKVLRYGRSRSFKMIETGTDRKPACDFLLVFHCLSFIVSEM